MHPGLSTRGRAGRAAVLTACLCSIPLLACSKKVAPDLSSLSVGQSYDQVVQVTGARCEHVTDSGVRVVVWSYEDGSSIEAGIYEGTLSGLTATTGQAERRASVFGSPDMSAEMLHEAFGDQFVTVDDSSDRECRWRWEDGRLSATFARGDLVEAVWFPADRSEPLVFAEVTDEFEHLLRGLNGKDRADRYRALTALSTSTDPRVADAVVGLLGHETAKNNRGIAAQILAKLGDPRANQLLMDDLEEPVVNVDVVQALGQIGDVRVERALRDALHRPGNYRLQGEIQSARAAIRARLRMPPPDRS